MPTVTDAVKSEGVVVKEIDVKLTVVRAVGIVVVPG